MRRGKISQTRLRFGCASYLFEGACLRGLATLRATGGPTVNSVTKRDVLHGHDERDVGAAGVDGRRAGGKISSERIDN
jgi:hypothetical protein